MKRRCVCFSSNSFTASRGTGRSSYHGVAAWPHAGKEPAGRCAAQVSRRCAQGSYQVGREQEDILHVSTAAAAGPHPLSTQLDPGRQP
jgi:hypothetical protein